MGFAWGNHRREKERTRHVRRLSEDEVATSPVSAGVAHLGRSLFGMPGSAGLSTMTGPWASGSQCHGRDIRQFDFDIMSPSPGFMTTEPRSDAERIGQSPGHRPRVGRRHRLTRIQPTPTSSPESSLSTTVILLNYLQNPHPMDPPSDTPASNPYPAPPPHSDHPSTSSPQCRSSPTTPGFHTPSQLGQTTRSPMATTDGAL